MWFDTSEIRQKVKLIKVEDNKYRISGKITGRDYVEKKIIVDSEEYINKKVESKVIDLDEMYENKESEHRFLFRTYETDFMKYFDKPEISLTTIGDFHTAISYNTLSTNEYVAAMQVLEENNAFPFEIHCGKNDITPSKYRFFNSDVEVVLFGYGFNNSVVCFLSYEECLRTKFSVYSFKVPYDIREEYFPENLLEMNEKQKEKLVKKYETEKIKYNKMYK